MTEHDSDDGSTDVESGGSAAGLGRAETAGVPVLLVGVDTATTVERLERVIRSGRARRADGRAAG